MENFGKELRIVPGLERFADDRFHEAHAELAAASLEDIRRDMPDIEYSGDNKTRTGFVDLSPQGDYEPKEAIAVALPFANDWGMNAAIRMRLMQRSLPEPRRVIVFPNNSLHNRSVYRLERRERATVASHGLFKAVAYRQLQVLENLGIERAQFFGYSQGAAVGAAAARLAVRRDMTVGRSGFVEAPNVQQRTPRQLKKDFIVPPSKFNQAVNDSAIPVLSEVQCARGGVDRLRQLRMFAQFACGTFLPDNRALQEGLARDTFAQDIKNFLYETRLTGTRLFVARAEASRIMPDNSLGMQELRRLQKLDIGRNRLDLSVIPGYGHEVTENIAVHALLARAALTG